MCNINLKHEPVSGVLDQDTAKDVRKRNGMTQKKLGEILGIDQSLVSKIETGAADITDKTKILYYTKLNEFNGDVKGVALPMCAYRDLVDDIKKLNERIDQLAVANSRLREKNFRLKNEVRTWRGIAEGDYMPMTTEEYVNRLRADGMDDEADLMDKALFISKLVPKDQKW